MNNQNFTALKYNGPNTNLTVGLADEHEWMGGASKAQNGIICNPNIPSEEVSELRLNIDTKDIYEKLEDTKEKRNGKQSSRMGKKSFG